MNRKISIKTKFGWISAFEEKDMIVKVKFEKCKNTSSSKNLKRFKNSLENFLKRKSRSITSNFLLKGSSVQKKVWLELKKIKFGKTKSYGEIAKKLDTSPRYVGNVCAQNNLLLIIPCHRVIRSDGSLGGFSGLGGIKLKKKLLKLESNV